MTTFRLYKLGMRILPLIPLGFLYFVCDIIAAIAWFNPRLRGNSMANLAHVVPNASKMRRLWLVYRVLVYVLRHYVDTMRMPKTSHSDLLGSIEASGLEHLAVLAETGGVLVVPHCGSFSPVLSSLAVRGFPIFLIVEAIQPPELLALISQMRASHGVEIVPLGKKVVPEMMNALKQKKIIVLAGDRDLANQSITTNFFDAPTKVPVGAARLALRGVPIVTAFAGWFGLEQSYIRIDPVEMYHKNPDETEQEALQRITADMIQRLEEYIRFNPAAWGVLQPVWPANKPTV